MSEGQSQKQKDQWRSYVFSKLSEDVDDQDNIRRIREESDDEGRDLGIKEYLERLKKLHEQASK
tara:strand:+ start:129 stop:320 length:192 start_codon:yes stop_codon:yes gene_type:complete